MLATAASWSSASEPVAMQFVCSVGEESDALELDVRATSLGDGSEDDAPSSEVGDEEAESKVADAWSSGGEAVPTEEDERDEAVASESRRRRRLLAESEPPSTVEGAPGRFREEGPRLKERRSAIVGARPARLCCCCLGVGFGSQRRRKSDLSVGAKST